MKAPAAVTTNSEYEEAKNFQANMFALRDDAAEVWGIATIILD